MNANSLPCDLRIVAWIFLYNGLSSLALMLVHVLSNQGELNAGILSILVYLGLMRLSSIGRKFGLVLLALYVFLLPIVVATVYFTQKGGIFAFFGQPIARIQSNAEPLFGCACFAIAIWMWKVLTRPEIVSLFYRQSARRESLAFAH